MPVANPTVKRNPIPAGKHLFCLTSVEEVEQTDYNDKTKQVTRWYFQFKSKTVDPETGDRFEFRQYTGPNYGHPKATLTILLDQMLPDWTEEAKGTINTDEILNTYYEAMVRHEKPKKAGDPPTPRLVMITPYKKPAAQATPAAKAAPEPEADEFEEDPFAAAGN